MGSDEFIHEAQAYITDEQSLEDIPKPQKSTPPKPLEYFIERYERDEGMARAYLTGNYTLAGVGKAFGVSYATVSRAVKTWELLKG